MVGYSEPHSPVLGEDIMVGYSEPHSPVLDEDTMVGYSEPHSPVLDEVDRQYLAIGWLLRYKDVYPTSPYICLGKIHTVR